MGTELIQCEANGNEMSLYYDTADDPSVAGGSNCATPTWVFNKAVTGDMAINETESLEEKTSRDPEVKYKQYMEAQPELEITGELIVDTQYDGWRYLNAIRYESHARNILALTQRITTVGAEGVKGKMRNGDRSKAGPQSGSLSQQFKLQPAACVRSGCRIIPILVAVSGTAATYDPGAFTVSVSALAARGYTAPPTVAQLIAESALFRSLWNTEPSPQEDDLMVFTDISPVIQLLGLEQADTLSASLVELNVIPPETPAPGTRKIIFKPTGMAGYEVRPLLAALREIVGNDKAFQNHKYMTPKWMPAQAPIVEPVVMTTKKQVKTENTTPPTV